MLGPSKHADDCVHGVVTFSLIVTGWWADVCWLRCWTPMAETRPLATNADMYTFIDLREEEKLYCDSKSSMQHHHHNHEDPADLLVCCIYDRP